MSQAPPRRWFSLPAWFSAEQVVVRAELHYWRKQKFERINKILIGGIGLLALLISMVSTPFLRPILGDWNVLFTGAWLISAGLAWLLELMLGLAASGLAAFAIAREREAQTWVFLQVSNLSPMEIIGGKWAALFHFLRPTLMMALFLRIPMLIFSGLGIIFSTSEPAVDELSRALTTLVWSIIFAGAVLGSPLPLWAVAYNGAIGLAASSLTRARNQALIAVVALHFVLGIGSVTLALVGGWWASLIGMWATFCVLQALIFFAFFNFTLRRAQQLAE